MPRKVVMVPKFIDAAPFPNKRQYRLAVQLADDGSNMAAVLTAAQAVITQLDVLTWDHIEENELRITIPQAGAAANIAANNNVEAFSRCHIPTLGDKKTHFSVPAWDDLLYDQAPNHLLDATYDAAAATLAGLIVDLVTGEVLAYDFSQSRGIKRGQRLVRG